MHTSCPMCGSNLSGQSGELSQLRCYQCGARVGSGRPIVLGWLIGLVIAVLLTVTAVAITFLVADESDVQILQR